MSLTEEQSAGGRFLWSVRHFPAFGANLQIGLNNDLWLLSLLEETKQESKHSGRQTLYFRALERIAPASGTGKDVRSELNTGHLVYGTVPPLRRTFRIN